MSHSTRNTAVAVRLSVQADPVVDVSAEVPDDDSSELFEGPEITFGVADSPPDERNSDAEDAQPAEPADEIASAGERRASAQVRNFLATYFREMSALSVLQPEEEFSSARDIEQLELELWETLLSFPPTMDLALRAVERALDNSLREFRTLRERAMRYRQHPTKAALDRVQETASVVAPHLRMLDIDRRYVAWAIDEMERIARGESPRFSPSKPVVNVTGAAFLKWLEQVRTLRAHIHAAKNSFVLANLRLVVSIARRFNYGRMPFADLIQEGNIGLMKAVDRFDYKRGYRFSTYASWWIRHAISRALADKGRAVRLPVHMIDTYHRVAKASRELSSKLGRLPTSEEIGQAAGVEHEKVERMKTFLLEESYSLDRNVSEEDDRRFIDFLTDPDAAPGVAERLATQAIVDEVLRQVAELKPIEADILRRRFGLDTDEESTLKQIGDRYHLSRERIRQLQEQALSKVRKALARKEML